LEPLVSISNSENEKQNEEVTEEATNSIDDNHHSAMGSGEWEHDLVANLFSGNNEWISVVSPLLATSLADHEPVLEYRWYNYWTKFIMDGVHIVHDETGLTYASCIVIFTAMTRIALMPLAVWSRRHEAFKEQLQEKINALYELKADTPQMRGRLKAEADRLRDQSLDRWQYRWIYPVTSTMAIIFMFIGLRQMCNFYPDEFEEGESTFLAVLQFIIHVY
jgi:hypothetical protein